MTKKVINFWGKNRVHPHSENPGYTYEQHCMTTVQLTIHRVINKGVLYGAAVRHTTRYCCVNRWANSCDPLCSSYNKVLLCQQVSQLMWSTVLVIQQGTAVSTDEPTHAIHCARHTTRYCCVNRWANSCDPLCSSYNKVLLCQQMSQLMWSTVLVIQQGTAVSTDEPTHVIHCARILVAG